MNVGEGNGKVYIGIPRERIYFPEFVDNRDAILTSLTKAGLSCDYYQAQGHRVDRNRDRIVLAFLKHPLQPEWLLMIDSDMEHIPDLAQRLLACEKPIVGGLYFYRGQTHDPFAFRNAKPELDEYGRTSRTWAPMRDEVFDFLASSGVPLRDNAVAINGVNGLTKVDAVATGAMLIHRSVLEAMQPGPWFEYETGGNSEDLMFCARATEKYGFDIYCDFSTISGHYALVPMGYAEFINKYQQRGVELSSYTPTEAIEWFAEFFEKPKEDTTELFKRGSPHFFGDYWKSLPDTLNENTEREIYRNATSGRPYIVELLYWNASPEFLSLRQRFISIRNRNVIEIGAGIGTLALQLAIQRNNVLAVEVNPVLRKFIKYRLKKTVDNIETKMGNLKVAGDGWLKAHTKYDVAFALDVFEHMPLPDLKATIDTLGEVLVTGGHLYYHNNWGQQDIFPMHHDYADIWSELLVDAGFYQISPNEAVRT